jgi:Immunity protein 10
MMIVAPAFAATDMSIVEEHGVLITTLSASSIEGGDFYLMLQHQDEYTAQDTKLEMNMPYIEYCGQGCSWYGEIEKFELRRESVHIQLSQTAADHMQNGGLLDVAFKLSGPEFETLRTALRRTFSGQPYFAERV